MPLSEHEQKLLEQLERQLHEDDPKFASSMGSDPGRTWSTRHIVIGVLATLAGGCLLRHHAQCFQRQGFGRRTGKEVQGQELFHEQP